MHILSYPIQPRWCELHEFLPLGADVLTVCVSLHLFGLSEDLRLHINWILYPYVPGKLPRGVHFRKLCRISALWGPSGATQRFHFWIWQFLEWLQGFEVRILVLVVLKFGLSLEERLRNLINVNYLVLVSDVDIWVVGGTKKGRRTGLMLDGWQVSVAEWVLPLELFKRRVPTYRG